MGLFNSILGNASQVNIDEIKAQFENVLVENENIEAAFSLFRDKMVFTNKRIIFLDKQNVTGSKKEYLSVPYHAISVFSVESAGTFDADAEIKLWVRELGQITKKVGKNTDTLQIQKILASSILQ
ncbi:MAG: PH domain-containing protein [Paludibacteraceae bacterium]|nr:PH domain-containing protein [Paludibacteraceae bacterium]